MSDRGVLVLDIGGSKLAAAIGVRDTLQKTTRAAWDGPTSSTETLMDTILAVSSDLIKRADHPVTEAVVAMPGLIDSRGTRVIRCANLPFRDFPLADAIATPLGLAHATLADDVNCGALGEATSGAARGYRDSVYLSVSTGISSGIIIGGTALEGASRTAGEIGHITVVPGGRLCGCGRQGCLEAYCSGRAFAARGREIREDFQQPASASTVSAVNFLASAYSGDTDARAFVNEAVDHLEKVASSLLSVLDPSVVCVGGGLMNHSDFATDVLKAVGRARPAGSRSIVTRASLSETSVLIGALALAASHRVRV